MSFVVRRKLSPQARKNISKYFNDKRIENADRLLDEVDALLSRWREWEPKRGTSRLRAVDFRETLKALQTALRRLDDETMIRLTYVHWVVKEQDKNLLLRGRRDSQKLLPAEFGDLVDELATVCEVTKRAFRPRRGAPEELVKRDFTFLLLLNFESITRKKPTAQPDGAFDTFLRYVLEDVTDEPERHSRKKLIEPALRSRKKFLEIAYRTQGDHPPSDRLNDLIWPAPDFDIEEIRRLTRL